MKQNIFFETPDGSGDRSRAKAHCAEVNEVGLNRRARRLGAVGVAAASLALASMSVGATDPRGETLVPLSELVAQAGFEEDEAVSRWSEANARQAVAYGAGYAFGYEQVYTYGCGDKAEFGEWFHLRNLVNSQNNLVLKVITANNDTIYSLSALALDAEPWVFSAPESLNEDNRYWSLMIQDAASNVPHVLGSGTTGTGDFVIAYKDWTGPLPKNLPVYLMDSPFVWPLIRTGVNGPDDLEKARAIQDEYVNTPLSQYCDARKGKEKCKFPKGGRPEVQDSKAQEVCDKYPPPDAEGAFTATPKGIAARPLAFWDAVTAFTKLNLPPSYETALVQLYKDIFVGPASEEDNLEERREMDPAYGGVIVDELEQAPKRMAIDLPIFAISLGVEGNGWSVLKDLADYGNTETGNPYNYLVRGAVNLYGPGGLPAREALYYNAVNDGQGVPLSGMNRYRITFPDELPVNAFWSLTMYQGEGSANPGFLYDNGDDMSIDNDIYSLGTTTAIPEADGKTIILDISHSPTGDKPDGVKNWLPAPPDGFYMVVRTYVPKEPDTYFPPEIENLD